MEETSSIPPTSFQRHHSIKATLWISCIHLGQIRTQTSPQLLHLPVSTVQTTFLPVQLGLLKRTPIFEIPFSKVLLTCCRWVAPHPHRPRRVHPHRHLRLYPTRVATAPTPVRTKSRVDRLQKEDRHATVSLPAFRYSSLFTTTHASCHPRNKVAHLSTSSLP